MDGLIILAVTFGLMWVLFILPRQRQVRAHQALVASLQPGDEIVSGGGIFGTITAVEADEVRVEVADGVELRLARAAVLRRLNEPAPEPEPVPADEPDTADEPETASAPE